MGRMSKRVKRRLHAQLFGAAVLTEKGPSESQVNAAYLLNFLKFLGWSDDVPINQDKERE